MPKNGNKTRVKILDETTSLVLENGFAGTTIDQILSRTKMTKGAFFYHFKSKMDLAHSLIEYFAKKDMEELNKALTHTEQFQANPKERLLRFVQWFIDLMSGLEEPYPGCLYASYVYEPEQFNQEIKDIVAKSVYVWRDAITQLLETTAKLSKPKLKIDFVALADHFTVILEGAFIVSKTLNDPNVTANQLTHYKNYLELIFEEQ